MNIKEQLKIQEMYNKKKLLKDVEPKIAKPKAKKKAD